MVTAAYEEDETILRLGRTCDELGRRLIDTLSNVQKQARSKHRPSWASFPLALCTVWTEDEMEAFTKNLRSCRQQITTHLIKSQR